MRDDCWWRPIAHFASHVAAGTAIFVIIAVPAVLLNLLVDWLTDIGVSWFILTVLTTVEWAIVVIDSMLFLAYLVTSGWAWFREMNR